MAGPMGNTPYALLLLDKNLLAVRVADVLRGVRANHDTGLDCSGFCFAVGGLAIGGV